MIEVVVEHTLPYHPAGTTCSGTVGTSYDGGATAGTGECHAPNPGHHDPMDLSNLDNTDLYTVDNKAVKRCFHCTGFSHLLHQCPTPNSSTRTAQFRQKNELQRDEGNSEYGGRYQQNGGNQKLRRESSAPPQPVRNQPPPRQPQRKNPAPTRKPFAATGKLYMVGDDQRMIAVDEPMTGSGAYFGGSWADSEDDWEAFKGPRVVELGDQSDKEKDSAEDICEGAGKAKQ
jgi:hypothetical protein